MRGQRDGASWRVAAPGAAASTCASSAHSETEAADGDMLVE
jgi:hypothetical protein